MSFFLKTDIPPKHPSLSDEYNKIHSASIGTRVNELIVVHSLRPDRLMASAHLLVSTAFGQTFMQQDKVIDLQQMIDTEVRLYPHSSYGYFVSNLKAILSF